MKIASNNLQMSSTHSANQRHEIDESLRLRIGRQRPDFGGRDSSRDSLSPADRVRLSDAGRAAQNNEADAIDKNQGTVDNDPKLQLIKTVVEFLMGTKIKVFDARELGVPHPAVEAAGPDQGAPASPDTAAQPQSAGYGVEYDYHESYSETERTTFSANGVVQTTDGREIHFQLDLTMERSFREDSQASLRLGDAVRKKDPLVLNFGGTAAQLTDTRFAFDLDADGQAEQINAVGPGSGFLVLDRNQDGKVNDGLELFGPSTGDGFSELGAFDDDHNGWIDESDGVYRNLRIWTQAPAGGDRLQTLAEAKVGALALTHIGTPFDINDDANRMKGQVRSSGVFLQEDGGAGTLQQIDLTA